MSVSIKSAIGRADLAWMLEESGDSDERAFMADSMGFDAKEEDDTHAGRAAQRKKDVKRTSDVSDGAKVPVHAKSEAASESKLENKAQMAPRPLGFWRVKTADIKPEDSAIEAPPWFNKDDTLTTAYLRSAKRDSNQRHLYPFLTPWARLWPFFRQTLSRQTVSQSLDVPKLVGHMSRLKPIARVPRKKGLRWADNITVLIDKSVAMAPFRKDMKALCTQLVKLCGKHRTAVYEFSRGLTGLCCRVSGDGRLHQFALNDARGTVLVLTDLTQCTRNPKMLHFLHQMGERLVRCGGSGVVLTPGASDKFPAELREFWCISDWDFGVVPGKRPLCVTGKRVAASQRATVDIRHPFSRFMALISPLSRLDTEVLRHARSLPGLGDTFAVWEAHTHMKALERQRRAHRALFKDLPFSIRKQFVELVYWCHAGFLDVRAIEFATIRALDDSEEMGELLKQFKDAEAALNKIVATMAPNQRAGDVPDNLQEFLKLEEKLLPAKAYSVDDRLAATWVLARLDNDGRFDEGKLPPFIPLDKVSWILDLQQTQQCRIAQAGESLVMNAPKEKSCFLATIPSALPNLKVNSFNAEGVMDSADWTLNQPGPNWLLPRHENRRVRIESSHGYVELDQITKPWWADEMGRDREGLYIQLGDERYYWLAAGTKKSPEPPDTAQRKKGGRMEWAFNNLGLLITLEKSSWVIDVQFKRIHREIAHEAGVLPKISISDVLGEDEFGAYRDFEINGVTQRFRWIPPGEFMMGSPEDEPERRDNETQHHVTLTKGFWLADTACTQRLWQAVMGENPSKFIGNERPVESVSWEDCQEFVARINKDNPELNLALPTEAQWEYACRAGTGTRFSFGDKISPEQVNYGMNTGKTVEVKSLPVNPWGLYEMHGNVREWCADWYGDYPTDAVADPVRPDEGVYRVLRGGAWLNVGGYCRSAYRYPRLPVNRSDSVGFRLSRGPLALRQEAEPESEETEVAGTDTGEATSEKTGFWGKWSWKKNKR